MVIFRCRFRHADENNTIFSQDYASTRIMNNTKKVGKEYCSAESTVHKKSSEYHCNRCDKFKLVDF